MRRVDDWLPKPNAALDLTGLSLDPEQGFVLSRIDGRTSLNQLVQLTGLSFEHLLRVMSVLVREEAVLSDDMPSGVAEGIDAFALLHTLDDQFPIDDLTGEATSLDEEALGQMTQHGAGPKEAHVDIGIVFEADAKNRKSETGTSAQAAPLRTGEGAVQYASPELVVATLAGEEQSESAVGRTGVDDEAVVNWRQRYQSHWRAFSSEKRAEAARNASADELHAFCFDQNAKVLRAVLENSQVGLTHVRLLAQHHVNGAGLETLGKNAHFLRDGQVQRALLRNAQLTEPTLARLLQSKALAEVYRISASRDVTERVRNQARRVFRAKFVQAAAEEKTNLIVQGEGRCLAALVGIALDGKSTGLLSQRTIQSTLLVQNLARWPSTPPPVLLHLAKQPIVLRSPPLKHLVIRHPNATAQVKRQLG